MILLVLRKTCSHKGFELFFSTRDFRTPGDLKIRGQRFSIPHIPAATAKNKKKTEAEDEGNNYYYHRHGKKSYIRMCVRSVGKGK